MNVRRESWIRGSGQTVELVQMESVSSGLVGLSYLFMLHVNFRLLPGEHVGNFPPESQY